MRREKGAEGRAEEGKREAATARLELTLAAEQASLEKREVRPRVYRATKLMENVSWSAIFGTEQF